MMALVVVEKPPLGGSLQQATFYPQVARNRDPTLKQLNYLKILNTSFPVVEKSTTAT